MSASVLPPSLRPAARSAYRAVLRSARITFEGDQSRRAALVSAVRLTFSSPTLTPPSTSSAQPSSSFNRTPPSPDAPAAAPSVEELAKRIEEWREVALFLRRNVVQGVMDGTGSYRLRVTPDTELGDNSTIREPPILPTTPFPNRNRRRKCSDQP